MRKVLAIAVLVLLAALAVSIARHFGVVASALVAGLFCWAIATVWYRPGKSVESPRGVSGQ
jgi:uncharacterized protein (DUF58 family)